MVRMLYAYFVFSVLLVGALILRAFWPKLSRRLGRVAPGDEAAITLFLSNRDEAALSVEKSIWSSLPRGRVSNIYGMPDHGRLYRVTAQDAVGGRSQHDLIITGSNAGHDLSLYHQNSTGFWIKLLQ